MWPFGKRMKAVALNALAGIHGPTTVDLVATVASLDHLTSPISGLRGAALQIELFARPFSFQEHREMMIATSGNFVGAPDERALGVAVLGDFIVLRADDGAQVSVSVRKCTIGSCIESETAPLRKLPPDLVPLFGEARGVGDLSFRELALKCGDRVRLRAVVVPSARVIATEYRSAAGVGFETRDAVTLDRVG